MLFDNKFNIIQSNALYPILSLKVLSFQNEPGKSLPVQSQQWNMF